MLNQEILYKRIKQDFRKNKFWQLLLTFLNNWFFNIAVRLRKMLHSLSPTYSGWVNLIGSF